MPGMALIPQIAALPDSLKWVNAGSDVKVEAGQVTALSMMGHTSIHAHGNPSDLGRR